MLECASQLPTSPVHYRGCHLPCASLRPFCSIADRPIAIRIRSVLPSTVRLLSNGYRYRLLMIYVTMSIFWAMICLFRVGEQVSESIKDDSLVALK
jgi:hypothetical protein